MKSNKKHCDECEPENAGLADEDGRMMVYFDKAFGTVEEMRQGNALSSLDIWSRRSICDWISFNVEPSETYCSDRNSRVLCKECAFDLGASGIEYISDLQMKSAMAVCGYAPRCISDAVHVYRIKPRNAACENKAACEKSEGYPLMCFLDKSRICNDTCTAAVDMPKGECALLRTLGCVIPDEGIACSLSGIYNKVAGA